MLSVHKSMHKSGTLSHERGDSVWMEVAKVSILPNVEQLTIFHESIQYSGRYL